jgi:hypothetical protein
MPVPNNFMLLISRQTRVCVIGSIAVALAFAGCSHNSPNSARGNSVPQIAIRGTIPAAASPKRLGAQADSAAILATARKVLVCQGNLYSLATITNGSFTASASRGAATALVFLDSSNTYLGNLFAGGLNMLPLTNLKNGDSTVIDLTTLTLSGTGVVPAHNPLGDEIMISGPEIEMLRAVGGYYESLAKNLDADNNGIPDVLSDRQLLINTLFNVTCGKYGVDGVAPVPTDTASKFITYSVRISADRPLIPQDSDVAFSGPVANPYPDIVRCGYAQMDGFLAFFQRQAQAQPAGSLPFEKGTYTVTLNGSDNYTLDYSNIDAKYFMAIAAPTLHTNSEGKLVSISVTYTLSDGSTVDPASFITNLQFLLHDSTGAMLGQYGSMYESIPTSSTITDFNDYTLPAPIDILRLLSVSVNYNDLLGNEYNTSWQ